MLPEFPRFKPIDLADRPIVEAMIADFPPFADFNFVELYCWNRGKQGGIAKLEGNLVVRWQDCITGDLFLSFLGTNKVGKTASKLIDYAKERGIEPRLQAIPDVVIDQGDELGDHLEAVEDTHNSDYLLSVEEWAEMAGSRFKNKRNAINKLERNYTPDLRLLDVRDAAIRADMMRLCALWAEQRGRSAEETQPEFGAIRNVLELGRHDPHHRLSVFGAFIDGSLVGFSVNEILPNGYALGHFAKADYRYDGMYPFMLRGVCRHLRAHGVHFLNVEADLGDSGLAEAKKLCHPKGRLRKFVIAESSRHRPTPAVLPMLPAVSWSTPVSA